jgi:uncharacterized protein (DUF2237 family)
MALKIICVTGPGSTGKSSIIREFTARHLKYKRAKGDVLGIFRMPQLNYVVGVSGGGDNVEIVRDGLEFLESYDGLSVIIVASHLRGQTIKEVKRFAKRNNAVLQSPIETKWLASTRERNAAIMTKVSQIRRLMPGRDG